MALHSLGKILISSPGLPVQATVNQSSPNARIACYAIMFQALPNNIGNIYIGLLNMNKTTLAQCVAILSVPTVNSTSAYSVTITYAPGGLNAADFYIDSDQVNDGVLVSMVSG